MTCTHVSEQLDARLSIIGPDNCPWCRIRELESKCAHCPRPAVVNITLGDPINYSLCQRCSDLEENAA